MSLLYEGIVYYPTLHRYLIVLMFVGKFHDYTGKGRASGADIFNVECFAAKVFAAETL